MGSQSTQLPVNSATCHHQPITNKSTV